MDAADYTVLGLETSCDETAAAVVRGRPGRPGEIRANVVWSQVREHAPYGGVVPEIAARAHVEVLDGLVARAMREAGCFWPELDGIAATAGPGLIGGVIVGLLTAKGLALAAGKPLLAVNHLEGHALSARLVADCPFPYLLLLVSGGHCQLLAVEGVGRYRLYGGTRDDAAGEAFDKSAKLLGLGFPGGPAIERAAAHGDPARFVLPRPLLGAHEIGFSFSGLKTAVRTRVAALGPPAPADIADMAASLQAAVIDTLAGQTERALTRFSEEMGETAPRLVVAGGVAANRALRARLERLAELTGARLIVPPPALCTDNGAMIAWAGLERLAAGRVDGLDAPARARWPLAEAPGA